MTSAQYALAQRPAHAEVSAPSGKHRHETTFNPAWHELATRVEPRGTLPRDTLDEERAAIREDAPIAVGNASSLTGSLRSAVNSGRPLAQGARNYFEPHFGADFSTVKIATGAEAERASSALNARAFTHGQTVVFGKGQYAPESAAGKQLLAHELTHTIQQRGATATSLQRAPDKNEPSTVELGVVDRILLGHDLHVETASSKHGGVVKPMTHQEKVRALIDAFIGAASLIKEGLWPDGPCPPKYSRDVCIATLPRSVDHLLNVWERMYKAALDLIQTELGGDQGLHRALGRAYTAALEALSQVERSGRRLSEKRREQISGVMINVSMTTPECFDFAYASMCDPPRALEFADFQEVTDGSLDPFNAHVSAQIEGQGQDRFRARLDRPNTEMEERPKSAEDTDLLKHERLHWAIACHLVQLANAELESGAAIGDINAVMQTVSPAVQKQYDDEAYATRASHIGSAMGQRQWDLRWCRTVEAQFRKALRERRQGF